MKSLLTSVTSKAEINDISFSLAGLGFSVDKSTNLIPFLKSGVCKSPFFRQFFSHDGGKYRLAIDHRELAIYARKIPLKTVVKEGRGIIFLSHLFFFTLKYLHLPVILRTSARQGDVDNNKTNSVLTEFQNETLRNLEADRDILWGS